MAKDFFVIYVSFLLYFFIALASLGLCSSLIVHLVGFFKRSSDRVKKIAEIAYQGMYFVAVGFIVIALQIRIVDGYSFQEFWNMFVYDSPIWMQYISSFFIYYGLLNYAVLFLKTIFNASNKLIFKTNLSRDRTSQDNYLSMSGTNMGFYSVYIIIFYSALHILNDRI